MICDGESFSFSIACLFWKNVRCSDKMIDPSVPFQAGWDAVIIPDGEGSSISGALDINPS
jgi:hypothetical protein